MRTIFLAGISVVATPLVLTDECSVRSMRWNSTEPGNEPDGCEICHRNCLMVKPKSGEVCNKMGPSWKVAYG